RGAREERGGGRRASDVRRIGGARALEEAHGARARLVDVDEEPARGVLALREEERERRDDVPLDRPLERPRPVARVVAGGEDLLAERPRRRDGGPAPREPVARKGALDLAIGDPCDRGGRERG